jgi:AraC-like DNA-binding protein
VGWQLVLKDLGLVPSEMLKRAKLPGDLFSRRTASLNIEEYFRFWHALEDAINNPSGPLNLGQGISVESFNPSIFAAFYSPNLNVCMRRLSQFKRLICPMLLNVYENDVETTIEIECLGTEVPLPSFLVATEFVFFVHLVRQATREAIKPILVMTQTQLTDTAYVDFFGLIPKKGKTNRISFLKTDAQRSFLTENESMWKFFEPNLQQRLAELDTDASSAGRVRSALLELLPSGQSSIENVVKKLGVSKRTLQRRLSDESTTFQKELNQIREGLARHYFKNSNMSSAEVSFLIGIDDPNSFVRAFHLWTGKTPERVRQENII